MAQKHVLKLSSSATFFKDDMKQLERGENSFSSGHVQSMAFDASFKPALLKGKVQASMKNRTVEISIDTDHGIVNAICSCPRGQVICHHMAALCVHVHHNISVTDQACSWNAPSSSNVEEVQTIGQLYPCTKKEYKATVRELTTEEVSVFKTNLQYEAVGYTWLLKAHNPKILPSIVVPIEEMLCSKEYMDSTDKRSYLFAKCSITWEKILEINNLTIGQSNENWLVIRKHRLTASKFAKVISAWKRQKFAKTLFATLGENYTLENISAVRWGREHEKTAITAFTEKCGLEVVPSGLWLDKCVFLGASPDGLIGDDTILEIKCPYKFRNSSLQECLQNDRTYIIRKKRDEIIINKNHQYWHQIQGQLHICQRSTCYLFIWTPNESEIVIIEKDEEWKQNITFLKEFFITKYVPHICGM